MINHKYIFLFSILALCMPAHMKGMETVLRKAKETVNFLDEHSGVVLCATLGILALSVYDEESDSDEEEYFNKQVLSQTKKTQAIEKKQNVIVEESDNPKAIDMELAGWALLWDVLTS